MDGTSGWRAGAFALTAGGALVAAIGTTVVWISVGLRTDTSGVLDSDVVGLDLAEGVAVLALAAATVIGLVGVRRVRETARVGGALVLLALGLAVVALPLWVAIRAEDRALEEMAGALSARTGLPVEAATELIRAEPELRLDVVSSGVLLSAVGGAIVVLGSGVTLVWARRSSPSIPPPLEAPEVRALGADALGRGPEL